MNIAQKFLLKNYQLSMKLKAFTPLLVSDIMMQFLEKHQTKQCDIHVVSCCVCETPTPEKIHGLIKACTTCKKAIKQ